MLFRSEPPPAAFTPFSPSSAASGGRGGATPAPEPKRNVASAEESEFTANRRRNWARLIAKVYLCDPERCPSCGERMKIVAAISSPHQDEVIEKILRHLNLRRSLFGRVSATLEATALSPWASAPAAC